MLRNWFLRSHLILALALAAGSALPLFAAPWLPFGPDGGDARRIAGDPHDSNHLYLGAANGWIYESRNAGANWKRLAQVGKRDDLVLDSIVVDPANPRHIIVGAWVIDHADGGIFISSDGGLTWINQAEMRGQSVRALAVSVSDPKTLVAGSLQGVFVSSDSGQRWKRISPRDSTEIHEIESVAIDPVDPNVIYAGTWHLPWKTTDGGEHWDNIKEGIIDDSDVFSIIVDPKSPKIVYASACSGIYKSEDAGLLFHKIQGIPLTSRRTRSLLQDPVDRDTIYAGTTEGLFKSEDAGKTWTSKTGPEIIVNDVVVDTSNSRHVLIATDRGGVLSSDDGGDTFHPSNGGFSARQVTAMVRDSLHPAVLYVGVVNDKEWGGVFRSDNGGLAWMQLSNGLQGKDVFSLSQAADGSMIAGTAHGLFRLDQEEGAWKRLDAPDVVVEASQPVPHTAPAQVRPPVPIGRNHFAERKTKASLLSRTRATRTVEGKRQPVRKSVQIRGKGHGGQKTQTLAVSKRRSGSRKIVTRLVTRPVVHRMAVPVQAAAAVAPQVAAPARKGFDGGVYSIVNAQGTLLAATSEGLLRSSDDGATWVADGPPESMDWHHLASAKRNVVAASMTEVQFSDDSGATWVPVKLPEVLTRVAASAVEPSGTIWVGGREGVFVSQDAGNTWNTPKNLYVTSVSSLFYDEASNRVMLTTIGGTGSYNGLVFTVQLPQRQITYVDTGWTLRFARPMGDHLVAATLYDGIVVQPKMMVSPLTTAVANKP